MKNPIYEKIKLIIFIIICVLLVSLFIFAGIDMGNTADDFVNMIYSMNDNKGINSKGQFSKKYNYQQSEDVANNATGGNSTNALISNDKIGNYPIEYYVGFPLYEGTMLSVSNSDGGFGPLQATHATLADIVDKMYDTGLFPWLASYSNDPSSYLSRCQGNDHANHSWMKCKSSPVGSKALADTVAQNCTTPEQVKQFYDQYAIAGAEAFLVPAIESLKKFTGKSESELLPGTIACLFAINIRGGPKDSDNNCQGITSGMTDDEMIDIMMNNAQKCHPGDGGRWICGRSVYKAMNAGTIDIYGSYQCDGSCGTIHKTSAGKTFGELFGKVN